MLKIGAYVKPKIGARIIKIISNNFEYIEIISI